MSDCGKYRPEGKELATIQSHLPVGWAWIAARMPGKNLYQLLDALAGLYGDMSEALCDLHEELNPYKTTDLLPEWERAVGLPDSCFPAGKTIEERRANVVQKLKRPRYTLLDTWRDLARSMGINATITAGDFVNCTTGFDYSFPLIFDAGDIKGGRFRIYIDAKECQDTNGFDYEFPVVFGQKSDKCEQFRCLIERIRPCYAIVIWGPAPACEEYVPPTPWYETEYPGSTYAIRLSRVTSAGDSIAPYINKTGVPVSWDFGDGSPLKSDNNGAHTYTNAGTFDLTIVFFDEVDSASAMHLGNTNVSGDVAPLAALTNLTSLALYNTNVSGDVAPLAALTNLTYVHLGNTNVSGDVAPLAALTNLTYLVLYITNVSGDIAPLAALTNLTYLALYSTNVSGDVAPLAALTNLTGVHFGNTNVSGDVAPLAALTSLTTLYLHNTNVSGDVAPLAALTSLTILYLYSTNVDVDSVADGFWSARNNFTATNLYIHIGGTNPDPVGIYQDVCAPTTPFEKIYNLVNAQCPGDTFNPQTWVY